MTKDSDTSSVEFKEREFDGVRKSTIFLALASREYVKDALLVQGFLNRQIRVANALRKPVLIAFEDKVDEASRSRMRALFDRVNMEVEWRTGDDASLQRVADAAKELCEQTDQGEKRKK